MTADRLTLVANRLLAAYTVGMAGGQILFKLAAIHLNGNGVAARDACFALTPALASWLFGEPVSPHH
jgi:hypothetical protein